MIGPAPGGCIVFTTDARRRGRPRAPSAPSGGAYGPMHRPP